MHSVYSTLIETHTNASKSKIIDKTYTRLVFNKGYSKDDVYDGNVPTCFFLCVFDNSTSIYIIYSVVS